MIILVGAQKGGCGKSTLAINLAVELTRLGKDICLVDADRQSTSNRWAQVRYETDMPQVNSVAQYEKIHSTLIDLKTRYDHVVVDVAGRDSIELRSGLTVADLLLTPFRPSVADLDTLPHLSDLIEQVKTINENLTCKAVLTMASSNPTVNEVKTAKAFMNDFQEFEVCKSIIRDRKAYRDSLIEGKGVVEWDNSKAKAEIQLLVMELKL